MGKFLTPRFVPAAISSEGIFSKNVTWLTGCPKWPFSKNVTWLTGCPERPFSKNVTWLTRGTEWPFRCLDMNKFSFWPLRSKQVKLESNVMFESMEHGEHEEEKIWWIGRSLVGEVGESNKFPLSSALSSQSLATPAPARPQLKRATICPKFKDDISVPFTYYKIFSL